MVQALLHPIAVLKRTLPNLVGILWGVQMGDHNTKTSEKYPFAHPKKAQDHFWKADPFWTLFWL